MTPWKAEFIAWLGKAAADVTSKRTVRTQSVKPGTEEAKQALRADLKPAWHVAPTRYGRKRPTRIATETNGPEVSPEG